MWSEKLATKVQKGEVVYHSEQEPISHSVKLLHYWANSSSSTLEWWLKTLCCHPHSQDYSSTCTSWGRAEAELGLTKKKKKSKIIILQEQKPDLRILRFNPNEEMPIDIMPYVMITWGLKSAPQVTLVWQRDKKRDEHFMPWEYSVTK